MNRENKHTCCFIGHRTIRETNELKMKLRKTMEDLIVRERVDTFLFGRKSRFEGLCLELVTEIQKIYPHSRRVYVRADFPIIREEYKAYLLENYEETYYPASLHAGKAVYVERNREMIDNSHFCIIYYDEQQFPDNRKSGTAIALAYARKRGKRIIPVP